MFKQKQQLLICHALPYIILLRWLIPIFHDIFFIFFICTFVFCIFPQLLFLKKYWVFSKFVLFSNVLIFFCSYSLPIFCFLVIGWHCFINYISKDVSCISFSYKKMSRIFLLIILYIFNFTFSFSLVSVFCLFYLFCWFCKQS